MIHNELSAALRQSNYLEKCHNRWRNWRRYRWIELMTGGLMVCLGAGGLIVMLRLAVSNLELYLYLPYKEFYGPAVICSCGLGFLKIARTLIDWHGDPILGMILELKQELGELQESGSNEN